MLPSAWVASARARISGEAHTIMNAARAHLARNAWGRIAIASLLIAELAAAPAVVPNVLTAAAAGGPPTITVTPASITAGDAYTVTGSQFNPNQPVALNVLPACVNLPAGNPAKPGTADPTCATDGGHPEKFANGVTITPAADGSFSQSFFSSPLLSDATYNIVAKPNGQASAALTVKAASPSVTLSTTIIPDFFFIG